ncbi:NifB/NifX family molybdenum-iron cluster-binding protein [Desulfogranum mediterraneum]|uniref:NifB/NifX family molybdenum-iron cluster-binding protein n=1 Tax=Desulfogranum mediterraneum TaxID=160661 RepID=UPI00040D6F4A|nr:hypothetical protein [Desulfogranum mediterraneum]
MKILVTIRGNFVSPRFDLTGEVMVVSCYNRKLLEEPRSIILSEFSAEQLCDLALKENVGIVVCGGIEEQHYRFLTWKKIKVIDSVIGPYPTVIQLVAEGALQAGTILPGTTSCGITE